LFCEKDNDFKPIGEMGHLIAMADSVEVLRGHCTRCGTGEATFTARLVPVPETVSF
jgi:thymidine kinase